ncbi:MAG TPA: endonuclease/exonuclease/phosphatase family protein [Bellilinea sp.]|nr:endonuclease/exonuclease/phosphatase family protein [Bellilinea sp.]
MESTRAQSPAAWKFTLFFTLLFLLFFQLTADFIETIYAFGLLGTNIPPEIVSVLFFFSPLVLLTFKPRIPLRTGLVLTGVVALLRSVEVVLDPSGKMLISGLGVGLLLIIFPIFLSHIGRSESFNGLELSAGLTAALALSVLLRTVGAGSDISLLMPWISWLLCAVVLAAVVLLWGVKILPEPDKATPHAGFCPTAALSAGFLSALYMLYFAFTSPTVLARWSAVDYRLILLTLGIALSLFFALLAGDIFRLVPRAVLIGWNLLFLASGTVAILINQVMAPVDSQAFPIYQPVVPWAGQIPLFMMILLSPVILLNFILLSAEFTRRRPSNRQLAGGFAIAALVFLIFVLAQVFTTVYDYIPVIGPWFRDRFWLVFLVAGLGLAVPMLWVTDTKIPRMHLSLRQMFVPLVVTALVLSVVSAVLNHPTPETSTSADSLRVLTYNIQQGYDTAGRRAYQQQLEVIRALQPDLLGLQESDVARFSGGNGDVVRTLAEGLDMYSYYGPKTVSGTFGIAILSRYPLENPQTFYMYSIGEQTAAISAEVVAGGVRYHVLVTHLGNGGPIIQQQQVLGELAGKQNVIAMGDFNFRPSTEQYELTTNTLESAWVLAGSPLTTDLDPERLIDHVFVSPGVEVTSAEYIVSPVSDHPGLLVEIAP